jgi:hypothetical protein
MSERAPGPEVTRVVRVNRVTPDDDGNDEGKKRDENGNQRRAMLYQSDAHEAPPRDGLPQRVPVARGD